MEEDIDVRTALLELRETVTRARNVFQGRFHSSAQPNVSCVCLESLSRSPANPVATNVNRGSRLQPKVRFSAKNVPPVHIH